jgi:hypothetical protein
VRYDIVYMTLGGKGITNSMHCYSQFIELTHIYMFRAYQEPIIRRLNVYKVNGTSK